MKMWNSILDVMILSATDVQSIYLLIKICYLLIHSKTRDCLDYSILLQGVQSSVFYDCKALAINKSRFERAL